MRETWKEPGFGGTKKKKNLPVLGVYDKVPVQNIKNKLKLLMRLVCLLLLVAGRSRAIISALSMTHWFSFYLPSFIKLLGDW